MTPISRRSFITSTALAGMAAPTLRAWAQSTPQPVALADRITIDLPGEPVNIHPAKAYSDIEWAIVHSVFDAVVGFNADGALQPIGVDSFVQVNDTTWEVSIDTPRTFHDGSPVTAAAVKRGFELVQGSDSLVADIFSVVSEVEVVDGNHARIVCDSPSPWLPAQMAAWHVLVPESFDEGNPVGSGPYRFETWDRGNELVLSRNAEYLPSLAKGTAIADVVTYHFVPDASTRSSNIMSGATDIATFLPLDSLAAIEDAGFEVRRSTVAGSNWIRIATDTAPFDDVRVRQALNLALDLSPFAKTLVHEGSHRLASIHPGAMSLGFDPDLAPYAHDPEKARALLQEAGIENLQVTLEVTTDASLPVCEAIAAQWGEVGITAELVVADMATFNAGWTNADAPPLRMASWSPLFDPSTLLDLVFRGDGILSRYANAEADSLMQEASVEMDAELRGGVYQKLARLMHDDAACVYLWNLVNVAAVGGNATAWTPRADQWPIALAR